MNLKKSALTVLWLICFSGFVVQVETTAALAARIVFWGLLSVHAMEWVAFRELLQGSANGVMGNLTGTLLFGIVHIHEVRAEVEGQARLEEQSD